MYIEYLKIKMNKYNLKCTFFFSCVTLFIKFSCISYTCILPSI